METKIIEIRDAKTFSPGLAIKLDWRDGTPKENYLLMRSGYDEAGLRGRGKFILFCPLNDLGEFSYDPNYFKGNRTYQTVFQYLYENWESVKSGDVVDVRFILGESETPCKSEMEGGDV